MRQGDTVPPPRFPRGASGYCSRVCGTSPNCAPAAKALGPDRTRDELLPFLTGARRRMRSPSAPCRPRRPLTPPPRGSTETIDDEDEVLLVLAEQLKEFVALVGGPDHAHALLQPLEQLATVEESTVRDMAVQSINAAADAMAPAAVQEHVAALLFKLCKAEWFTARVSSTSLFPVVYRHLDNDTRGQLMDAFDALCKDETPMVRRAAAASLAKLVAELPEGGVPDSLFSLFRRLAEDAQDSVRLVAIDNAIEIGAKVDTTTKAGHVLPVRACVPHTRPATDKRWLSRPRAAGVTPGGRVNSAHWLTSNR